MLGIIALAIFFKVLNWLGGRGTKPDSLAVRGVLKKDTWASVYMQGGKTFERVRFIGFTNTVNIKTHLPYDLNGMVILEDSEGKRYPVRAKAIHMIVIAPPASEVKRYSLTHNRGLPKTTNTKVCRSRAMTPQRNLSCGSGGL